MARISFTLFYAWYLREGLNSKVMWQCWLHKNKLDNCISYTNSFLFCFSSFIIIGGSIVICHQRINELWCLELIIFTITLNLISKIFILAENIMTTFDWLRSHRSNIIIYLKIYISIIHINDIYVHYKNIKIYNNFSKNDNRFIF